MSSFFTNQIGFSGYSGTTVSDAVIVQSGRIGESEDSGGILSLNKGLPSSALVMDDHGESAAVGAGGPGALGMGVGPSAPVSSIGDLTWWELLHATPRRVDIGQIVGEVRIAFSVYNASRRSPVDITSIDLSGVGAGISVDPSPSLPITVGAQSSYDAEFVVSGDGAPSFDGTVGFVTDANDPPIVLTGFRIVVFPYKPTSGYSETLLFLTDVLVKSNRSEQRSSLRKWPRRQFDIPISLPEGVSRARFEMTMTGWQGRDFSLPLWCQSVELSSQADNGESTISVSSTTDMRFVVGEFLMLYRADGKTHSSQIVSVSEFEIEMLSPLDADYPSGTLVMPAKVANISGSIQQSRAPVGLADYRIRFALRDSEVPEGFPDLSSWPQHEGLPFLDDQNYLPDGRLDGESAIRVEIVDGETGVVDRSILWDYPVATSTKGFLGTTAGQRLTILKTLYGLNGRQGAFWSGSGYQDFTLYEDAVTSNTTIDVHNIGYVQFAGPTAPTDKIRVLLVDGQWSIHTITGAEVVSDDVERLTITPALGFDAAIADVQRIEFVTKSRFDSDRQTIVYDPSGSTSAIIPNLTVPDP